MAEMIFSEIGILLLFGLALAVVFGLSAGIALKGYFGEKFGNWAAYIWIRLTTNYQYQNSFTMDGEECQIWSMNRDETIIVVLDTHQFITFTNKQFKEKETKRNLPKRRNWNEKERQLYLEKQNKKNKSEV